MDATTEEEIEQHRLEDAAEARMDAARALLRILDRAPAKVLFSVLQDCGWFANPSLSGIFARDA